MERYIELSGQSLRCLGLAFLLSGTTLSVVNAQLCQPTPRCTQAQQKAQALLDRIKSGQVANISTAAEKGYCATMIGADMLEQCVSDFRAAGNETCANSLQTQADAYRQTANQFRSTFSSVTSGARISCK